MALDQLFGSKIDQIVQDARTQSDLTYCDQIVVIEGRRCAFLSFSVSLLMAYPRVWPAGLR